MEASPLPVSQDPDAAGSARALDGLTLPRVPGYQILGLLGQGGMGTVWRAMEEGTRRAVALKLMATPFGSARARGRFEREVELAAKLEHPHIARLYHSGTGEGFHFYAMELIEGLHLDAYVRERHLDRRQILGLLQAIAAAVNHAHQRGIIHRDLKPSNILVTPDGKPHIVDFGLAKPIGQDTNYQTLTIDGTAAGTLAYMSPEQAAGRNDQVDTRTDTYSLGAILFQLLTGALPHPDEGTVFERQRTVVEREVRRPRQVDPTLDRELESLLLKALAREPEQRYASAGDLAEDLEHYLRHEPLAARPLTAGYFFRKWVRRHRSRVALIATLVLLATGLAVYSYWRIAEARDQAVRSAEETQRALYFNRIALAWAELQQGNVAQVKEVLGRCPRELRNWEWDRLWYLADQSVRTLTDLGHVPMRLALSPDSLRATLLDPFGASLIELATGRVVNRVGWGQEAREAVGLSQDGAFAAAARGGTVEVYNVESGQATAHLPYADGISSLTFDPSGTHLATVNKTGRLYVWRLADSTEEMHALPLEPGRILCFGADGRLIAVLDKQAMVLDWRTGRALAVGRPEDEVQSACMTAAGERIITGHKDGTIHFWNGADGAEVKSLPGHPGGTDMLAISPDGQKLLSGGRDKLVRAWDLTTGKLEGSFRGHEGTSPKACWTGDSKGFVSGGDLRELKVWRLERSAEGCQINAGGDKEPVFSLGYSADGKSIIAGTGGPAGTAIWRPQTHERVVLHGYGEAVQAAALSPDGSRAATAGDDFFLRLWDARTAMQLAATLYKGRQIEGLAFSLDGRYIVSAISGDKSALMVHDAANGNVVRTLPGAAPAAFSADGRFLFAASPELGTVVVWQSATWKEVERLRIAPGKPLRHLSVSQSGDRLACAKSTGKVYVWDGHQKRVLTSFNPCANQHLQGMALSPDGLRLAVAGPDLTLWDAATGTKLLTIAPAANGHTSKSDAATDATPPTIDESPRGPFFTVAFSPDGQYIVAGGNGAVFSWNSN